MLSRLLLLTVAAARGTYESELTYESFDKLVFRSGHLHALVLFSELRVDCGACHRIMPEFDAIGEEYEDSTALLVGHVDCHMKEPSWGSLLCDRYEQFIKTYPTVLYFTPPLDFPDVYFGPTTSDGLLTAPLRAFARNLSSTCDPRDTEGTCTEEQQEELEKFLSQGTEELNVRHDVARMQLDKATAKFDEARSSQGQATYAQIEFDENVGCQVDEPLGGGLGVAACRCLACD